MYKQLLLMSALVAFSLQADTLQSQASLKRLLQTRECPQCDLRKLDLSGQKLQGVDLTGADLSGSNLQETNFRGAKLKGVKFLDVVLIDTMFSGADLRDADFSDLDIDEVFEFIEIVGTQLEGARFKYGVICGPPPRKGGWGCEHK